MGYPLHMKVSENSKDKYDDQITYNEELYPWSVIKITNLVSANETHLQPLHQYT